MSLTLTLERGGGEISGSGTNIELDGTIAGGAIESLEMYGDTEQTTYSGKNLNAYPYTGGGNGRGITFTANSDGTVVLNGQNDGQGNSVYFFFNNQNNPMTLPAGTYYIAPPSNTRVGFVMYDGTNYYGFSANNGYSMTFASSVSIRQFYVQVYHTDVTFSNLKIYPMLTTSAQHTEADFEPYVGGTASPNPDYPQEVQTVTGRQVVTITDGGSESQEYEINLGKNLLDIMDGTGTRGNNTVVASGQTVTVNTSGGSGTESAWYLNDCSIIQQYAASYSAARDYHLTAEGGTYTVTVYYENMPSGTGTLHCYVYTNKQAKILNRNMVVDNKIVWTVTLEADEYIKSAMIYTATANVFSNFKTRIQIEKGSTATTYAPYFTPIELCKISTYQDYFYKSDGDWYLHKETGKLLADVASGYIGSGDNYTNISYFVFDMAPDAKYYNQYSNNLDYKCTHATPKVHTSGSTWDTSALIGGISMDAAPTKYWLGFQKGTTLADMKSYLSGMLVYYPLATPTDTQITNSALIAQLEALNAGDTYDGTTLITVSSENLAGSLDVTVSSNITKTYTEVEIGSPFTIADVEGKSSNTTLDGNVYVDWAYNKKQYSFDLFNLTPQDYSDIRAFYDYQFNNSAFPTITVPELNIDKLPVYMEISSRNIINQCLLTDKLTIKFRETVQP